MGFYARYHRDPRNIASHFVGIPLIVLSLSVLLSRPSWPMAWAGVDWSLTPAWLALVPALVFYARLHRGLAVVMAAWLALSNLAGAALAQGSMAAWLGWGLGLFVLGWAIQFLGHVWEGRKPALADDLMGLLQGPLFLLVEAITFFGLMPRLHQAIVTAAGPVRRRPLGPV